MTLRTALGLLLATLLLASTPIDPAALRDGDVLFHESRSAQSKAIKAATKSRWTHVGVVLWEDGRPYVWEAVGPVKRTPVEDFVRRGRDGAVVVKRVAGGLSADESRRLGVAVRAFKGRPYDLHFRWDDARIYCSELVWKAYERGLGRVLVRPGRLGDVDLGSDAARRLAAARYDGPLPADEPLVSPADLFASPLLVTASAGLDSPAPLGH